MTTANIPLPKPCTQVRPAADVLVPISEALQYLSGWQDAITFLREKLHLVDSSDCTPTDDTLAEDERIVREAIFDSPSMETKHHRALDRILARVHKGQSNG